MSRIIIISLLIILFHDQIYCQSDTLLIFKRVKFKGYNLSGQIYYIDDILGTDTIKTNVKDILLEEFTYAAVIQGYQWEYRVYGNLLSQFNKDRIKSIMTQDRKLYFDDIWVKDKNGKKIRIKPHAIYIKRKPTKYFE